MNAVTRPAMAHLRPMREADLGRVTEIEDAAYPFPWAPGIFRDCLRAGYHCWVLDEGGAVVGYGILSVGADEAHVLNVCVEPARQGEGLGRRLVMRLIDLARWQRAQRVFLEVRPSNVAALSLYHDLGFNEIGRRTGYYPSRAGREDAIVMAMELLDGMA